jgi:hypothetical protein
LFFYEAATSLLTSMLIVLLGSVVFLGL